MNKNEAVVESLFKRNRWKILRRGWPDFLLISQTDFYAMAVEVKGPGDTLSEHQKIMHSFLEKIHLPVNVIHTDQIIRGKYKTFGKKLLALRLQYQLPIGRHIHELDFGPSL